MATLNPSAEIFIPTSLRLSVNRLPSDTNYPLSAPYNHHLPSIQSSSYCYPPLPLPYYKAYSVPPATTIPCSFSFASCASIPVFSTSTATCTPPISSNYYNQSSLGPYWYECINPSTYASQPFLHTSRFDQGYSDHQSYGLTSVPAEEVENKFVHEEKLENPPEAIDFHLKASMLKGKKKKMNKPPRLGRSHHHYHPPADLKYNQKEGMVWKPKSATKNANGVNPTTDHDTVMDSLLTSIKLVDEQSAQLNAVDTTLMIRNIPIKYTREMLINLLEDHCKEENQKGATFGEDDDERLSAFDFLYLPIDFKTGHNKGYAFVNMINSSAARKLNLFLTNYKWRVYESKKICKISPAKLQGKEALVKHFRNSYFECETDTFLPLCLSPYRNGLGGFVVESTVGKCCVTPNYQIDADGGITS